MRSLALAKLSEEAGIPAGVLQVIIGEARSLVERLLERPEVRAVSFTGSTEIGVGVMQQAAQGIKRVSLELGGKSANVVFADANLAIPGRDLRLPTDPRKIAELRLCRLLPSRRRKVRNADCATPIR